MIDSSAETKIPAILTALRAMPWAMHPVKFDAMLELVELRARGIRFTPDEVADRIGRTPGSPDAAHGPSAARGSSNRVGKVAILPLHGVIAQHARNVNQVSTPSGTSTEAFAADLDAALADETVGTIIIDIDSPGGSVAGVPELAARIRAARQKKPIKAIANGYAASAAYWIGSAASEFWVTPTGEVGSIGVFAVHTDRSEQFANDGIKHTIIKAGKYKAEGTPFEPLSDDAMAYAQGQVQEYYDMFVRDVAANRSVSADDVEANYGQGRTVTARAAQRRGMVDKIGTMEDLLKTVGISRAPGTLSTRGAEAPPVQRAASTDISAITEFRGIDHGELTEADLESLHASAGALALVHISPDHRPHEAKEHTVPEGTTASPPGAASTDNTAVIAAERTRVKAIMALCAEHDVNDANLAHSMIERGISAADAGLEILNLKRTQRAAQSPVISGMTDRAAEQPFATLGDQLQAIMRAERSGGHNVDKRLLHINATASGMSEGTPSDGGFLLQPEFAQEILRRANEMGEILKRVRSRPIGQNANGLKINAVDETSRQNGSRFGGVQVYYANEADTVTAKKPKLRKMELELKKLLGIWYATDELIADTTAMTSLAQDAFSEEITFVTEDMIINGTGAGQPLGIMYSGAVISVAPVAGQATATLNAQNLATMYSRAWGRARRSAVWLIDQSIEPQLFTMTLGGTTQVPIYLPPGGFSESPYGTIFGLPVIPVEYMAPLGTMGDIMLAALSEYLYIDKGGAQQAQSIHVRFLNDETTFRITYRHDGQPIWNQPLTPKNGGPTLSPFITLQARP